MPKYSITNAQFSPFSFEEMVRPYQLATEKYEKQVDAFNKLAEDVDAVDYLAQSLPDESPYKKQFNAYLEQFNKAGDTLSQGWSPDTASNLMNLRRMYHNTLVPIQKADTARTKSAEIQNAIRAKDPTARFEIDATDPNSLGYFLDNPGVTATKTYSTNAIQSNAATQIKNLKERLFENKAFDKYGDEGKVLQAEVLTDEMKADILANPEKYPNITAILNDSISKSGLDNWSDEAKERELTNAMQGALDGVSFGMSAAKDPNVMTDAEQTKLALDVAKANASIAASKASTAQGWTRIQMQRDAAYNNPANPDGFLYKDREGKPLPEDIATARRQEYYGVQSEIAAAKAAGKNGSKSNPQTGDWMTTSQVYEVDYSNNKTNGNVTNWTNNKGKIDELVKSDKFKYTDWVDVPEDIMNNGDFIQKLTLHLGENVSVKSIENIVNNIRRGHPEAYDIKIGFNGKKMTVVSTPKTYTKAPTFGQSLSYTTQINPIEEEDLFNPYDIQE